MKENEEGRDDGERRNWTKEMTGKYGIANERGERRETGNRQTGERRRKRRK